METKTTRTFESRIKVDHTADDILLGCAHLFTHIRHRLFADIASGKAAWRA